MAGKKWTPEQREKFKKSMTKKRKTHKAKPANSHHDHDATTTTQVSRDAVIYAHGRVEGWLAAYAERLGVPFADVAGKVGQVLLSQTRKAPRA